jgi:hypothetical protein
MSSTRLATLGTLFLGACLGVALQNLIISEPQDAFAQNEGRPPEWITAIEEIKGKLPDQAHAMQDVGYHYSNLWFAGQNEHWDLAQFYWNEVRSHLHWAVRIIPVRKDNEGADVKLEEILEAFENGPLKQLNDAIGAKNREEFEKIYRTTLEGCYACHKASDKPFIRPQVPSEPEISIINFDPAATWPR